MAIQNINPGGFNSLASTTSNMGLGQNQFSVDQKSVVDASIIEKLRELGYILTIISNDSAQTMGILNGLTQYIWPSTAGNVPAFRDATGIIYIATDRGQLFRVDVAATP